MKNSKLTKSQFKTFTVDSGSLNKTVCTVDGTDYRKVQMTIRFDDQCGNGHNSFSMTGEAHEVGERKTDWSGVSGCIHEILFAAFPELSHLIKWHLSSTDGPMHYIANTTYHARECTHEGKKPGDAVKFERVLLLGNSSYPLRFKSAFMNYITTAQKCGFILSIKEVEHQDNKKGGYQFDPKYTLDGFNCEWYQCPFDDMVEAKGFIDTYHNHGCAIVERPTHYAQTVNPDTEAARRAAIWEDATLKQLQDKEALKARLPSLLAEMKNDIESIGFEW